MLRRRGRVLSGKTERLKQVIVERIRVGTYPVGQKLPGVRTIAREFEIHPNTVGRVYADLAAEGVVRTVHGSGTFVIGQPQFGDGTDAAVEMAASLRELATQARRLGLSRKEFGRLAVEAEAAAYEDQGPAMWFVECSRKDTEELAAGLSTLLERNVRPLLTFELPHHLVSNGDFNQFFITTPFHVEEVEAEARARFPVVNVNLVPTSETLVRFARIDPGAKVSVVASNQQTLERFVRMIQTYTRIEPVAAVLADSEDAPAVVRGAEVLIDSQSIHDKVMAWSPSGTIVTVRYQIEPTSVAYLREVLRQREAGVA